MVLPISSPSCVQLASTLADWSVATCQRATAIATRVPPPVVVRRANGEDLEHDVVPDDLAQHSLGAVSQAVPLRP
eukprot:6852530-Lingulodinium_polyedra.AAC.1